MLCKPTATFLTVFLAGTIHAQTIYNDGAVHIIDGPIGPVIVQGLGTTLKVVDHALVNGVPGDGSEATYQAIRAEDATNIAISGGSVLANSNGDGVVMLGKSCLTMTGGFVRGSDNDWSGSTAIDGISGTLISGGTLCGGNGQYGGSALSLVTNVSPGISTINGGTFVGGHGTTQDGDSLDFITGGNSILTVSGGIFQGDIRLFTNDFSVLDFHGSGMTFTRMATQSGGSLSGLLAGTLANGDSLSAILTVYAPLQSSILVERRIDDLLITLSSVPEPSSIVILALGIGLVYYLRSQL